ncbi:MAG: diaminohydroxyphosphoribosylaminopyrimidine reductase [Anaerolineaceae bacterium]|nr:MAG: diaminohydroxyphosphoribosylaminopyrimidine reductase [Anaerolineaceae bacterium]
MKRPFVFINVAMTLDGKIDTFARKGSAISSPRDKARVNQLRAEADAVMVGGRTLLDEDPKLTVKSEALRAERIARGLPANPLKVGVVSEANIGSRSEFLHEGGSRVVLFTTSRTAKDQLDLLRSQGADIFVHAGERVDLPQAMNTLAELGVKRLMVEGGAILNFELLRLGLVDEVYAFVAPMIFGGQSAPTLASGAGLERSADAISLNLLNAETWEDGGILLTYSVKRQRG